MTTAFAHPPRPIMFCMVVTPMHGDGSIDEDGLRAHLRRMVAANVGVYLGSGGSGEGHALTLDELGRVYRIGAEECLGKVPVYCNPPESRSAAEMLTKAGQAIEAGVDLIQYYQLDAGHGRVPVLAEQEMYFRDLLEAHDYPVGLAIHSAVGYLAPSDLVIRLCRDYPQIKLVNLPIGPTHNYQCRVRDNIDPSIKIYVGIHNVLTGLMLGAWGAQITEPNQIPNMCQAVVDRFVDGDLAGAAEMYAKVLAVTDVIDTGRLVSADGPKAALKALGYDVGPPRHPRVPVDEATVDKMRQSFERLGVRALEESLSPAT